MTPFVEACVNGPGIALISSEIACTLFEWLEPADCTRLAMRMWDARGDSAEAVTTGFTPLHVAASRARTDFIAVYMGQESIDMAAVINAESASGCTPLDVCGSRILYNYSAVVECALALVAAGARWGPPREGSKNALHAVATIGSDDALRRLLAAPGASPEVVNAQDEVRADELAVTPVKVSNYNNWSACLFACVNAKPWDGTHSPLPPRLPPSIPIDTSAVWQQCVFLCRTLRPRRGTLHTSLGWRKPGRKK